MPQITYSSVSSPRNDLIDITIPQQPTFNPPMQVVQIQPQYTVIDPWAQQAQLEALQVCPAEFRREDQITEISCLQAEYARQQMEWQAQAQMAQMQQAQQEEWLRQQQQLQFQQMQQPILAQPTGFGCAVCLSSWLWFFINGFNYVSRPFPINWQIEQPFRLITTTGGINVSEYLKCIYSSCCKSHAVLARQHRYSGWCSQRPSRTCHISRSNA